VRRVSDTGFTIIELLIGMVVLAIIAGLDVLLLQTGLEAWSHTNARVSLQRAADELMENLLEGGYDGEGIRDAVELTEAGRAVIGFVPLWTDRSHQPDPVRNQEQRFILERQFKPGAPTPIGQVKKPDTDDFLPAPIKFTFGEGRNPEAPDDVVQFTEPIPLLSELKIIYTPDGSVDPEVIKVFRWDPATYGVYESYGGKTKDLLQKEPTVQVERCIFLYYDNLNRLLPTGSEGSLSSLNQRRATAVKLYLVLRRGPERRELTSFTNVRNVTTIGATITEGAQLPMPTPEAIRAFSIGDFYGLKRDGIVEMVVRTRSHQGWKISLKFKKGEREEDLILERFRMESPPGKILTSEILEQTIAANEFVSIQALDRSGLYDYDEDEEVKDLVNVTGADPVLTVMRLDFEGASLFVRP
jgi:prepilin-type N-terminal cleavage/methylation domain-containing protein